MRKYTPKRRAINADAQEWRESRELWPCERCRNGFRKRSVHEICNGIGNRWKALKCGFATLVLCESAFGIEGCHPIVQRWSETKQLAFLYLVRRPEYDLKAYLELTRPTAMQRITQEEVNIEADLLLGQTPHVDEICF